MLGHGLDARAHLPDCLGHGRDLPDIGVMVVMLEHTYLSVGVMVGMGALLPDVVHDLVLPLARHIRVR